MKKILLFLFLAMPLMSFAQKSYIHIYVSGYMWYGEDGEAGQTIYLTGDIPNGIKYYYQGGHGGCDRMTIGTLLNKLSREGFIIESQSMAAFSETTSGAKEIIIMSRGGSSNPAKSQSVTIEEDGDPHEVARYNLQGLPVKKHEKGVQIVVFSNYTTKTIIVE